MLANVPLFLEYEAVLTGLKHLLAIHVKERAVLGFLNYLAGIV
jgi:hypothetical protein